jgi:hypothetical protein
MSTWREEIAFICLFLSLLLIIILFKFGETSHHFTETTFGVVQEEKGATRKPEGKV